jgi:hypothetical protein
MQAYLEGLKALVRRKAFPASFNANDWQAVAPAIRQRSFFSATVESAKVLNRFRNMLLDWQSGAIEDVVSPSGIPSRAFKVSGLADFRQKAGELLIQEGLATPADFKDNSLKNIASMSRLKLIFNTNTQQAQEFAAYEMRVTDPAYINMFPAARFVRRPGAIKPRLRHVEAQGQVRRWDDFAFWLRQNAADIGGFQVPWGPWGFNSYMTQQPISRAEAEQLNLIRKGERILQLNLTPWGIAPKTRFNAGVEATVDDVTPEIRQQAIETLKARLGPGAIGNDGKLTLEQMIRIRNLKPTDLTPLPAPIPIAITPKPAPRAKAEPKAKPAQPPASGSTVPAGSTVSSKINFGQVINVPDQDSIRAKWDKVKKTIDEVHGDGPLPTTLITHKERKGPTNGEFYRYNSDINTFNEKSIPMTLTHEIGHWIDYRGFRGIPGAQPQNLRSPEFASHSPLFKKFISLAKKTNKIQAISSSRLTARSKTYLRSKHEIFARAYAQYIATKSKNPDMLANLRDRQGSPVSGENYPDQWDDDDFKPLYDELETILKQVGWLKTT